MLPYRRHPRPSSSNSEAEPDTGSQPPKEPTRNEQSRRPGQPDWMEQPCLGPGRLGFKSWLWTYYLGDPNPITYPVQVVYPDFNNINIML